MIRAARQIPLLDLRAQLGSFRNEALEAIARVADSQRFILGEEVEAFEREIAAYSRAPHAIGCASGSDALRLSLLAHGIGAGDQVLTSPFTFFATAGEIHHTGATPVFADIDAETFNIAPAAVAEALAAHPRIKAVIPVHLFGGCADMDPILDAARTHGTVVIEDAAQSIGAEYKGRRAGSIGAVGCFSFFPSKNLGAFGDAGMCTAADPAIADELRALRVHGSRVRYYHDRVGVNSRLDALQAAVLRVKLRYLDGWTAGRQLNAALYRELLAGTPVGLPSPASYQTRHIFNQFVIRAPRRDELRAHLQKHGIGTEIYYPLPLHLQKCFAPLGYRAGDFPASERAAAEVLALPVQAERSSSDLEYIAGCIREFYAAG